MALNQDVFTYEFGPQLDAESSRIRMNEEAALSQPNFERQSDQRVFFYNTPGNTLKAYQPEVDEFNMYCKRIYSGELEPSLITPDKVYCFLYYQAYRTKKKRPKKRAVLVKKDMF